MNSAAGYPTNSAAGYPTNSAAGYPTNSAAGYPTNSAAGYPTNSAAGYPTNSATGYPTNSAAGYPTNSAAGYPTNSAAGYPTNSATGYPTNSAAGYPTNSAAGYPTNSAAGYPTNSSNFSIEVNKDPGGSARPELTILPQPYTVCAEHKSTGVRLNERLACLAQESRESLELGRDLLAAQTRFLQHDMQLNATFNLNEVEGAFLKKAHHIELLRGYKQNSDYHKTRARGMDARLYRSFETTNKHLGTIV
ncbi:circumsporozoite protein, putative [Perkinsus marinus ATCC 50983]|uniref:Circumsporozoite protein, putative n=1 Tax=Perkinsus marinus (strain ATCC 50983 / TXsc) TaxID=423536 RepID=C5LCT8_PERM5|nr:circumsporozoite protein, putative [Perkinsus marinus ATCC 50983]EER05771.1 circumsporozoite protein, putative [Perkinsus marinus ATCC 50983]|eukprot:XP_002773955.1 circumsporozoite protein, putative [Perkinsus marinus ATCC 50983]